MNHEATSLPIASDSRPTSSDDTISFSMQCCARHPANASTVTTRPQCICWPSPSRSRTEANEPTAVSMSVRFNSLTNWSSWVLYRVKMTNTVWYTLSNRGSLPVASSSPTSLRTTSCVTRTTVCSIIVVVDLPVISLSQTAEPNCIFDIDILLVLPNPLYDGKSGDKVIFPKLSIPRMTQRL